MIKGRFQKKIFSLFFILGEPSKKKNYEILDIVQKGGGVSAAAKLFIDERYGHVYRGGGGWSSSSKLVFGIKVCFVGT